MLAEGDAYTERMKRPDDEEARGTSLRIDRRTVLNRRTVLKQLGLTGVTLVVLSPVACGGAQDNGSTGTGPGSGGSGATGSGGDMGTGAGGTGGTAGTGGMGAGGQAGVDCALTPEQTEGPFYLDDDLLREDITEAKPGVPLRVVVHVVALPDCTPLAEHAVDLWHADHLGQYSGFSGQGHQGNVDLTGETFLRGTQLTDAGGEASFTTIYPGWYPGRAVHIHFKVHLPGNLEVTSQLYFPDATNEAVHQQAPYDQLGSPNTSNAQDGILSATPNEERLMVTLAREGQGYVAELVVGVMPA